MTDFGGEFLRFSYELLFKQLIRLKPGFPFKIQFSKTIHWLALPPCICYEDTSHATLINMVPMALISAWVHHMQYRFALRLHFAIECYLKTFNIAY